MFEVGQKIVYNGGANYSLEKGQVYTVSYVGSDSVKLSNCKHTNFNYRARHFSPLDGFVVNFTAKEISRTSDGVLVERPGGDRFIIPADLAPPPRTVEDVFKDNNIAPEMQDLLLIGYRNQSGTKWDLVLKSLLSDPNDRHIVVKAFADRS